MKTTNARVPAVRFGRTVKVQFPTKPSDDILAALRTAGFSYARGSGWTHEAADFAEAARLTKLALEISRGYVDLGEVWSRGIEILDAVEAAIGDVPVVVFSPRVGLADHVAVKGRLLFESITGLRAWWLDDSNWRY